MAYAFTAGDCVTYSSGRLCQSIVVSTSVSRASSCGRCAGPTRTAFARKICLTRRSLRNVAAFRMISSNPGMARNVSRAARSAGSFPAEGVILGSRLGMAPRSLAEKYLAYATRVLGVRWSTGVDHPIDAEGYGKQSGDLWAVGVVRRHPKMPRVRASEREQ